MPQHPASRSVTCAPGIRRSSAAAAAASPIDRWWQCGCSSTDRGPGLSASEARPAASSLLEKRFEQDAGAGHGLGALARRRRAAAPAGPRAPPTGSSARRRRWPRPGPRRRAGRPRWRRQPRSRRRAGPARSAGARSSQARPARAPMPACSQDVECRLADVRVDVLGEGVGEEHRPRRGDRRSRRGSSGQGAADPDRRYPAAVDARGRSPSARPSGLPAIRLDSGASRLPQRASRRTWPKAFTLSGAPCRAQWPASTSLLMRAMSTLTGHSLLHARHSRQRSRASCRPGSSSPCGPSWPVIARRSTLARPRVECASSRVAMYEGHIVPSPVLRQAPTPLHASTARPKPPLPKSKWLGGSGVR